MKPRAGGTLMVQGEDDAWYFVQIESSEYVLLSTRAGARLHSAAHLEFVKIDDDGTSVFKAVKDAEVLSLIFNLGPPARGEHQGPFGSAAQCFAAGSGCPVAQHCSAQMEAKKAAWPERIAAQRDAETKAKAAKAEKEARLTLTPTLTLTLTLTLALALALTLSLSLTPTLTLTRWPRWRARRRSRSCGTRSRCG